jgi:hypothetical protein
MLEKVENLGQSKWDWVLPRDLLVQSYASMHLDIVGAKRLAARVVAASEVGRNCERLHRSTPRSRNELTQCLRRDIIDVPKCGRDLLDLIGRHLVLFEAQLPFAHGSPDSRDALGGDVRG